MNDKDVFVFYSRLHNEDADPYIGGNILAVADGLGGSGSTVHKVGSTEKWAKDVESETAEFDFQGNKIYKELLNGVFDCNMDGNSENSEFISFINELCAPMTDEVDDTSAAWASRIVIARFVYALRFGAFEDCCLEDKKTRENLVEYITEGLETATKKFDLKKGELDQQYLLPTTLAAVKFTELTDSVIAEAVWAGDSRCYAFTPQNGLQLLTVDNESNSGVINNLFYVKDKQKKRTVLHYTRNEIKKPCVLIAASDGCFDPFGDDGHLGLEATLLTHMEAAQTAADCADSLERYFESMRYDDTSMAFVPFGFDDDKRHTPAPVENGAVGAVHRNHVLHKIGEDCHTLTIGLYNAIAKISGGSDPLTEKDSENGRWRTHDRGAFAKINAAFAERAAYVQKLWNELADKRKILDVTNKTEDDAFSYVKSRIGDKMESITGILADRFERGETDIALVPQLCDILRAAEDEAERSLRRQSAEKLKARLAKLYEDITDGAVDDLSTLIEPSPAANQYIDIIEKNERDILTCTEAVDNLYVALSNITALEKEEERLSARKKELQEYAAVKRRETDAEFDRLRDVDDRAAMKMSNINKEWQDFCVRLSENASIPPREYLRGALEGDPFISSYNAWSKEYNEICKDLRGKENSEYVKKQIEDVEAKKADCKKEARSAKEKLVYHIEKKISSDPAKLGEIFTDAAISLYGLVADRPDNTRLGDIVLEQATRLAAAQKPALVSAIVKGLADRPDASSAIDGLFNRSQLEEFRTYCRFKRDKTSAAEITRLISELNKYDVNCRALVENYEYPPVCCAAEASVGSGAHCFIACPSGKARKRNIERAAKQNRINK